MKKNLIIMLAALVCLAGLTWGAVALSRHLNPPVGADPRLVLTDTSLGELEKINVKARGDEYTIIKKGAVSGYTILGREAAYNEDALADLWKCGTGLLATELVNQSTTPELRAEYSLDQPTSVLEFVYKDGTSRTLTLGRLTDTNDNYYVSSSHNPDWTLLLPKGQTMQMQKNAIAFRSVPAVMVNFNELTELKFVMEGRPTIHIVEAKAGDSLSGLDTWRIVEPYDHPVRLAVIQKFFSCFYRLSPAEMVADNVEDFAPYGLADPTYCLTVQDRHGGYELQLGDEDPTAANMYYCRLNGSNEVYRLAKLYSTSEDFAISPEEVRAIDLAEGYVALVGLATVDQVTLTGAVNATLTMEHEMNSDGSVLATLFKLNGITMREEASKRFYQDLVSVSVAGEVDAEIDAEPYLTLTFRRPGFEDLVISYVAWERDSYAAVNAQGHAIFFATREEVEGIVAAYETYRQEGRA